MLKKHNERICTYTFGMIYEINKFPGPTFRINFVFYGASLMKDSFYYSRLHFLCIILGFRINLSVIFKHIGSMYFLWSFNLGFLCASILPTV